MPSQGAGGPAVSPQAGPLSAWMCGIRTAVRRSMGRGGGQVPPCMEGFWGGVYGIQMGYVDPTTSRSI